MESEIASIWYRRFSETGEILKRFYEHILKSRDRVIDYLIFLSHAERAQSYPWAYIDYGLRTPIYRTLQWINFVVKINWNKFIDKLKQTRKRGHAIGRFLASEVYKQLSKEMFLYGVR